MDQPPYCKDKKIWDNVEIINLNSDNGYKFLSTWHILPTFFTINPSTYHTYTSLTFRLYPTVRESKISLQAWLTVWGLPVSTEEAPNNCGWNIGYKHKKNVISSFYHIYYLFFISWYIKTIFKIKKLVYLNLRKYKIFKKLVLYEIIEFPEH